MASCDDDFSLLGDDNHHQTNPNHHHHHHPILHNPYTPHRFQAKSAPIHTPPQPILPNSVTRSGTVEETEEQIVEEEEEEEEEENENDTVSTFPEVNQFTNETNLNKRRELEDQSDGGNGNGNTNSNQYSYKKQRPSSNGGGEYRKDREEWSDAAIECLLDAYTEKFTQLNRGNLRGRDWEEVAVIVSERCQKQSKTVEQCKNKVDNLKKRYKLERHRMNNGGVSVSHWPWFKKMEEIVGNSLPIKVISDEYKAGAGSVATASGTVVRQSKR